MSSNKISIIIPHYNRWDMLADLFSTLPTETQSLHFEVIIVDDHSDDDQSKQRFLQIMEELSAHGSVSIRLIEQSMNVGASNCRNHGLANASGRYVHFLDSDDIILWSNYFSMFNVLFACEERMPDFVVSGREPVLCKLGPGVNRILPAFNIFGPLSGMIFSRQFLRDRIFDPDLKSTQDWDFYISLGLDRARNVIYSGARFFAYNVTQDSITLNSSSFVSGRKHFFKKNVGQRGFFFAAIFLGSIILFGVKRRMYSELIDVARFVAEEKRIQMYSFAFSLIGVVFVILLKLFLIPRSRRGVVDG
ncbi:glycosyltransferase [Luminiphilus sp.]|nr:glycosyltransferase [Luminiphilus sp.]